MDFKDISYILAIEKYGNITKAAEALYLSQPSLSRFLQNLEKNVGQPLFTRVGNKYIPTYIGERYIEHARLILQEKENLDTEVNDIVKTGRGALKVGFPAMRGTYLLPCTLPIFKKMHPNVKVVLREANSAQLNTLITEGEIDLAFYNFSEKNSNIECTVISHEELLMVMSPKNTCANKGIFVEGCKYPHLDLNLLKNTEIIMQRPGQRTRMIVDKMFRENHFEPNIVLETSNIMAAAELASRNYGVAFIAETHLNHMNLRNEIRCFSVGNPKTTVDFVAAYRKNSYLAQYAQDFIEIVKDFT